MNTSVTDDDIRQANEALRPYTLGLLFWSRNRHRVDTASVELEHQRRMVALHNNGTIAVLCPIQADTYSGIAIMTVPPDEARAILEGDPCVQAEIMRYQVHPCHGFPGDALPRQASAVTIQRMDHVGVVVDDLDAAVSFFVALGMEADDSTMLVEGDWVDRVVGLDDVRVEVIFVKTPDGQGRLELTKFHNPAATTVEPNAPANTLGLRRLVFAVDDIDGVVARMQTQGAELIGEIAQFENTYRLCYLRGPDGIIIALAQEVH